MINLEDITNKINVIQLAYRKVYTYSSIELIAYFSLQSINKIAYSVLRKGKIVFDGYNLEDAIVKFNSYHDLR